MADTVSMSLDEYIKKKKIRKPGNPIKRGSGKGKGRARGVGLAVNAKKTKWNAKIRGIRASVKAGAAVGGGGVRGRRKRGGAKRNNNQRRTLTFRTTGFHDNQNIGRNIKSRGFGSRKARGGDGRLSLAARRQLLQQQLQPQPGPSQNRRNPRRKLKLRGVQPVQAAVGARKRGLGLRSKIKRSLAVATAQQRLKKARAILAARRRILGANRAATTTVSGRILFSKYGLLTTARKNSQQNMITIQEKIQRAQLARLQSRQLVPGLGVASGSRRPAANLYSPPRRAYRESTVEFAPPSFYSGGGLYSDQVQNKTGPLRSRQLMGDVEAWTHTQRRVANTSYSNVERYSRQPTLMSARFQQDEPRESNLDPEIQHRISHIQQAGRRRREDPDQCLVIPDYRGPVASSRMPLGERFKRMQR